MPQITKLALFIPILLLCAFGASGQEDNSVNTYSPYTLYGIGDVSQPGFSANSGMAGITIGVRNPLSVDYHNPASLSVRDTLSFIFDFGIRQKNTYSKSATAETGANNFNLDYLAFSFRAARGLGIVAGLKPYSNVGYDIEYRETNPQLIYDLGDITYQFKGEGGINELFAGAGVQVAKNLSVGANVHYYFGEISRYYNVAFSNPYYSDLNSSNKTSIGKIGFSAGAQYYKEVKKDLNLAVGATFRPKTNLSPDQEIYSYAASYSDTINFATQQISGYFIPMEIGFGATIAKLNKLTVGLDFTYQDWSGFNMNGTPSGFSFTADKDQTIRLGVDYIPNAFDIRKRMKRWNYRAGVRFSNTYMICNGERIKDYGMTFGVGIPVTRIGTKFNASVEFGQRGTTSNGLIKENYLTFTLGASIYELWFRKYKYD